MKSVGILLIIFSSLWGEETTMSRLSETFGHLIYHKFQRLDLEFDIAKIAQGIQDAANEKDPPMDINECIEMINVEQEKRHKILSEENLRQAENFLKSNAQSEGVVSLESQKVQYKILSSGKGAEIKPHSSAYLRCRVKTLDGEEIFGTVWNLVGDEVVASPLEETVHLDQMVDGVRMGILGMKEGEKRIIYVHPDLSFKTKSFLFRRPNQLFVFEIEALKV